MEMIGPSPGRSGITTYSSRANLNVVLQMKTTKAVGQYLDCPSATWRLRRQARCIEFPPRVTFLVCVSLGTVEAYRTACASGRICFRPYPRPSAPHRSALGCTQPNQHPSPRGQQRWAREGVFIPHFESGRGIRVEVHRHPACLIGREVSSLPSSPKFLTSYLPPPSNY